MIQHVVLWEITKSYEDSEIFLIKSSKCATYLLFKHESLSLKLGRRYSKKKNREQNKLDDDHSCLI